MPKKKRDRKKNERKKTKQKEKILPVHTSKTKTENFVYKLQARGESGETFLVGETDTERDQGIQRRVSWLTPEAKALGCGHSK